MPMVADVRISWTKSPSPDVVSREVFVTINGNETSLKFGPEVESATVEVAALGTCTFFTQLTDSEGAVVSSEQYTFVLGDLVAPLPDTALTHVVVGVRDTDAPPAPQSRRRGR